MIRRWSLLVLVAALPFLVPGAADAKRMTMRVPAFEVQPRTNREICVFVPLPANAEDLDIGEIIMSNRGGNAEFGTHHLIIYAWTGDLGTLANEKNVVIDDTACLNFGDGDPRNLQIVATSQGVNAREKMPSGTALELTSAPLVSTGKKRAVGFVLNSHWINGSDTVQKARAKVTIVTAKKSKIKTQLKPIFDVGENAALRVPPGETRKTAEMTWGPGQPDLGRFLGGAVNPKGGACVTMIIGHMHRRGTLFTAAYVAKDGTRQPLYSNTKYSDPPTKRFDPPLLVREGEGIVYQCTHDNATDTRLGCEETAGVTPGRSVIDMLLQHGFDFSKVDGSAKLCHTAGPNPDECPTGDGRFTGNCVPANLVFGFLSDDDMCIMPGYFYDADMTKPAGQECTL